jgi:hypothetical protein
LRWAIVTNAYTGDLRSRLLATRPAQPAFFGRLDLLDHAVLHEEPGLHAVTWREEKRRALRMEFKTFHNALRACAVRSCNPVGV